MRMFVRVSRTIRVGVLMRVTDCKLLTRHIFPAIHDHIDFRGSDAVAINARDLKFSAEVESAYCFAQMVGGHSGVDECAEKHVAADSAETVEVRDAHR